MSTVETQPRAATRVDLRITWGSLSDVGKVRAQNQDSCYANPRLFVVADGLGAPGNGEVASAMAVQAMAERSPTSPEALVEAVEHANAAVYTRSVTEDGLLGMATTLCALAVVDTNEGHRLGLVNVGDSRVYRHQGTELNQLTLDHSRVAEMVRLGLLEPHEAETHRERNTLTRAVGVLPEVTVDDWLLEIRGGDRYLLCSDGITNMLTDEEIDVVLRSIPKAEVAADHLVQAANANGGTDNSTAMVVDVHVTTTTVKPDGETVVETKSPAATTPSEPEQDGKRGRWRRQRSAPSRRHRP